MYIPSLHTPSNNCNLTTYHTRLGITIIKSIAAYESFGEVMFGKKPIAVNAGKIVLGTFSKAIYSIAKLQEAICEVLIEAEVDKKRNFS